MTDNTQSTINTADISDNNPHPRAWTIRFNAWRKRNIPDYLFLIFLALVTGIITGLAAFTFKYLISLIAGIFRPHIQNGSINWWLLIIPVTGILLTGIFTRYIVKTNLTHGVAQLMRDLKQKTYRIRHNITFSPIIGGSITLGCGGSAGAEGPIAYAGAAIGSNIGQFLGMDPQMLKILIGCGTAAGIAGIFTAPVGGLLFALELLHMQLSINSILAVTAACITSFLTVYTCKGFHIDVSFINHPEFDIAIIPMVIALGIFCGIYSIYYSKMMSNMDTFYRKIKNPWIRNLTGGLILGTLLLIFPSMYSAGYPIITDIINGNYDAISDGCLIAPLKSEGATLIIIAIGILLTKSFAVSSTNSSGGVAGDFAPTLFAGSVSGLFFATVCNVLFGTSLPTGVFAFLGMAGVMAGAIEAPMMAIFIVMEMTQNYDFALPLAICALLSYCTVKSRAWIFGHHHMLILHHHWFTSDRPEPTINSTK